MMNWPKQKKDSAAKKILGKKVEENATLLAIRPIFVLILSGSDRVRLNFDEWLHFIQRLNDKKGHPVVEENTESLK